MRAPHARARSRRGFTMLELVCAFGILAVALLTLVAIVHSCVLEVEDASNLRVAREACRAKLESIVAGVEQGIGGTVEGHDTLTWSSTREEKTTGASDNPTEKFDIITVTITFPSESAAPGASGTQGVATIRLATIVDPPDLKESQKK